MPMRGAWIALLIAGCGGSQAGTSADPETEPVTVASQPEIRPRSQAAPREAPTLPAGAAASPAPELAIRGTPRRGGAVSLAIENRGSTTACVAPEVGIEVQRGETWVPLEGTAVTVRPDCEHAAPSCQELAPGAALEPPPWLGAVGAGQCACERCAAAPPGTYRFVVRTCDGAHTLPGESFELSP